LELGLFVGLHEGLTVGLYEGFPAVVGFADGLWVGILEGAEDGLQKIYYIIHVDL